MDDLDREIISEALRYYREILSGGLQMVGGIECRLATDAEKELCRMKLQRIKRAEKIIGPVPTVPPACVTE